MEVLTKNKVEEKGDTVVETLTPWQKLVGRVVKMTSTHSRWPGSTPAITRLCYRMHHGTRYASRVRE